MRNETTREVGGEAESVAAQYLERGGYYIRHRNFLCRAGEVDLVAERGETLCFVEVRMRSSSTWGAPMSTVSRSKQRRVVKAALRYLMTERISNRMIRFDVISITGRGPDALIEHIPDAFDAGM